MFKQRIRPLLLVLSAPSGAGKTTLGAMLLRDFSNMARSISCTTRPWRAGETDGRDYLFVSAAEFKNRLRQGYFLESAAVHGHWYGTPRAPVLAALKKKKDILLVIDVQGAARIRAHVEKAGDAVLQAAFVDIFVLPPDMRELKRRITKRGQDDPAAIRLRLKNAARELKAWRDFRYVLVNDRLGQAHGKLRSIVIAEHCRA